MRVTLHFLHLWRGTTLRSLITLHTEISQLWSWLAWRRQGGLAGDTAQRGQGPLSDPHLIVNVLLLDH